MADKFKCEVCGNGDIPTLRKEIYEVNGGHYHEAISFKGNRRVFRCNDCGNIWWTDPAGDFMHSLKKVSSVVPLKALGLVSSFFKTG